MSGEPVKWNQLKVALGTFQAEHLNCPKCSKMVKDPVKYVCGHFFCGCCVTSSETMCPTCGLPSKSSEITPDHLVQGMVAAFLKLAAAVSPESFTLPNSADKEENSSQGKEKSEYDLSHASSRSAQTVAKAMRVHPAKKATKETQQLKSQPHGPADYKVPARPSRARRNTSKVASKDTLEQMSDISASSVQVSDSLEETDDTEDEINYKPLRKSAFKKRALGSPKNLFQIESKKTRVQCKSDVSLSEREDIQSCENIGVGVEDGPMKRISRRCQKSSEHSFNCSNSSIFPTEKKSSKPVHKASSSGKSSVPIKVLEKPNIKGETPLHAACVKNRVDLVCAFLSQKANPNTKDFAGWAPLHEVAFSGNLEITRLLLESGAMVNIPGENCCTPLHEAVKGKSVPIVRLLVSHGADINALTSDGKTPLDLADNEELKEALLTTDVVIPSSLATTCDSSQVRGDMVWYGASGLEDKDKAILRAFAKKWNVKLAPAYNTAVTHLVAPSDDQGTCPPSMDILSAILRGIWILTKDWLHVTDGSSISATFELSGVTDFQDACAPRRSRLNTQKQLPGLLHGCHFFLTNNASCKMEGCLLSKQQLTSLIKMGGGTVLSREPAPESIPGSEQTIPYHASRNGALAFTSHYIIFSPGKGEPGMKYNMKHCKALTVEWLINCILNWKLIDP